MSEVTIYTKAWCPYCQDAKALLERKGVDFTEFEIDREPKRRAEMLERSGGRRTVPQVFIGATHVGGCDDLYTLDQEGELDPLLAREDADDESRAMISFTLACDRGHEFESWFASGAAFEQQRKRRLVTCPMCGSAKVDKTVMAPAVARTDNRTRQGAVEAPSSPAPLAQPPGPQPHAVLGEPERQVRDMIRALRKHVAENSDYVGHKFPEEARQMHHGEIEHRSIWGEASAEEAKALAEEGVEVHPLPVLPDERN